MPEKFHYITADNSGDQQDSVGENSDEDALETEQKALAITDRINELQDKQELSDEEQKELLAWLGELGRIYSPEEREEFESLGRFEALGRFESMISLRKQYDFQKKVFIKTNVLDSSPRGELSIKGIDGEKYPFPKYEEIIDKLEAKKEIVEKKAAQGFTKLIIVPFGMKLGDLINKYSEITARHGKKGNLLATKDSPADPDEQIAVGDSITHFSDEYKNADTTGKLMYHPEKLTRKRQSYFSPHPGDRGRTKADIVKSGGAWSVLLVEENGNIPREGKGRVKGARKQFETNKIANEYMKSLRQDQYSEETGLTPEDWLTYFILNLEETNQVTDDFQGKGALSFLTGAYFPDSDSVPTACWFRDSSRISLRTDKLGNRYPNAGARTAVKI